MKVALSMLCTAEGVHVLIYSFGTRPHLCICKQILIEI